MTAWKLNDKVVGYKKKVGNLELRTVNNAGHLVPMDQGEVALSMVDEFVWGALSGEGVNLGTD
jgi:carboxypeptidase C (cathepsin A)